MAKTNSTILRYTAVGVVLFLAALAAAVGYGRLAENVADMEPRVEKNVEARVTMQIQMVNVQEDVKEIKEDVKMILEEVRK